MTNILPLGGLILVKKIEVTEKVTPTGLIMTASTLESDLQRGEVIVVGPGERDQYGTTHPIPLDVGDIVYYSDNHGTEVKDSVGEKYEFVNWRNLFGREQRA